MESSIAVFLLRWFACEQLPTSHHQINVEQLSSKTNCKFTPKKTSPHSLPATDRSHELYLVPSTSVLFIALQLAGTGDIAAYPCGRGNSAISDA